MCRCDCTGKLESMLDEMQPQYGCCNYIEFNLRTPDSLLQVLSPSIVHQRFIECSADLKPDDPLNSNNKPLYQLISLYIVRVCSLEFATARLGPRPSSTYPTASLY